MWVNSNEIFHLRIDQSIGLIIWLAMNLKGQYHHDQSRLSTGHGIGVLV